MHTSLQLTKLSASVLCSYPMMCIFKEAPSVRRSSRVSVQLPTPGFFLFQGRARVDLLRLRQLQGTQMKCDYTHRCSSAPCRHCFTPVRCRCSAPGRCRIASCRNRVHPPYRHRGGGRVSSAGPRWDDLLILTAAKTRENQVFTSACYYYTTICARVDYKHLLRVL
ncbi:unnamed protein product [Laminaria digitata]